MNGDDESTGWRFDKSVIRMAFDALLALVVASVGFMVNGLYGELREIKMRDLEHAAAIATIRERLPLEYVRMDLYIRDRQEMMALLRGIDQNVREHREGVSELMKRNGK